MPKFPTPDFAPLPDVPIYCVREIAAYLRCSMQTVYNLIDDGAINAAHFRGTYRIRREDFTRWYQQHFGVLPDGKE